MIKEASS